MSQTDVLAAADDGALARIALSGGESCPAALQELCRRLAPRARLYALRHLRDPHAADDLAQEALLIFLRAVRDGRVDDPDKPGHFLLGICRNVLWNARREAARRQRIVERFGPDLAPAVVIDEPPLPEVDPHALEECLAERSQRERQILLLTFLEECDVETIASRLGLTGGNVRVIRHRTLRALRDCLDVRRAAEVGAEVPP
ncbi:MAG TPA: sigma-70 family RNA polymerase sigma factor [Chloroflexota bacterium]|nr:sigma-70 family RNA polymerase sigma factor [Chloroflexota bacterium]